jgi:hypothetical protein
MKSDKKQKSSRIKASLIEGFIEVFGELIFGLLAIGVGLGFAMLFPHSMAKNWDPELLMFIGFIVLLALVISVLAIIRFFTRRALEKDMKLIYKHFGEAEELTLLTISKNIGENTVNVPVIRGYCEKGRFELWQNEGKFTFSIEYSGKPEEEKYAEEVVADTDGAIKFIADFIA